MLNGILSDELRVKLKYIIFTCHSRYLVCVFLQQSQMCRKENIQRIVDSLREMQMVMRELAGLILSGEFSMSEESYGELKRDYLALVITVIDIVDGAAYLFEKEPPINRKNWKAELELEQYRHVLALDAGKDDSNGKEDVIEKENNS